MVLAVTHRVQTVPSIINLNDISLPPKFITHELGIPNNPRRAHYTKESTVVNPNERKLF